MEKIKEVLSKVESTVKGELGDIEGKVDESIAERLEGLIDNAVITLIDCESPIEQLLALELQDVIRDSKLNHISDIFICSPQLEVTLFKESKKEVKYRTDFLVEFVRMKENLSIRVAIECDGHDFHEKTKEQAARDKRRDRNLMENGIMVIRFTGSEIYEDAYGCAAEAMRIIENHVKTILSTK